jgi:serine/threonine protein kinase
MGLEEITGTWRLFYWLTEDLKLATSVAAERYRIMEIVPGGSKHSCIYFLFDKVESRNLALKVCKDDRALSEDLIIHRVSSALPGAVVTVHCVANEPTFPIYRLILMDKGQPMKTALHSVSMLIDGYFNPTMKTLLCDMFKAVQAVHSLGYYHKDLRIENFTAFNENGKLVPKLIDFGLATAKGDHEWSINNQECIRPPEFVFLNRSTPAEAVFYEANHDIYALCMAFMELLGLQPNFFLSHEVQHEINIMLQEEFKHCQTLVVRELIGLHPWYQSIRLIFFFGIPPKSFLAFHESPVGRYLQQKYRFFNLNYLNGEVLAEQLRHESMFLKMMKHSLDWDKSKRVQSCEQLFELYLNDL